MEFLLRRKGDYNSSCSSGSGRSVSADMVMRVKSSSIDPSTPRNTDFVHSGVAPFSNTSYGARPYGAGVNRISYFETVRAKLIFLQVDSPE